MVGWIHATKMPEFFEKLGVTKFVYKELTPDPIKSINKNLYLYITGIENGFVRIQCYEKESRFDEANHIMLTDKQEKIEVED